MKNRILSGLLVVLFLITAIPMFPMSASAQEVYMLGEIIGGEAFKQTQYTFAEDIYTGVGKNIVYNVSFDAENGLILASGGYLRIVPEYWWSPIDNGKVMIFKAKVANETAVFHPLWQGPTTAQEALRASFSITASGISAGEGGASYLNNRFVPGTDWVEYLLTADTPSTWSVYGKKPGEEGWTLVIQGGYGTNGGQSTGMYFSGSGYVKEATLYQRGDVMATSHFFAMGSDFDTHMVGVSSPEGAMYSDENGLDMTCGGEWKYLPHSTWRPLSDDGMVAFSAKLPSSSGGIVLQLSGAEPSLPRRTYIDIRYNGILVFGSSDHTGSKAAENQFDFAPETNWVDYLVKANSDETYSVYVKTNGVWELLAKTEGYSDSGAEKGIQFNTTAGSGGYIKNLRVYCGNGIFEASARPIGETQTYYYEEFDRQPDYANLTMSGNVEVQNSTAILTNLGTVTLQNSSIPLGGYAEIKVKANSAVTELCFPDEAGIMTLELDGLYDRMNGIDIPVAYSGDSWQIWRIVRNENGTYSGYCKAEKDEVWYRAFSGLSSGFGVGSEEIKITQYPHGNGGDAGRSVFDYIKIAGPGTARPVVLTDGGGTNLVEGNGKLQYPDSLCATVEFNQEMDRKLIFAEYGEDNLLLEVEIKDVLRDDKDTMETYCVKSATVDIHNLRVFLWDNFNSLSPVSRVITAMGDAGDSTNDWTLGGNVQEIDGTLILSPKDGVAATAEINPKIQSGFDLSWKMTMEKTGSSSVKLGNGSYAVSMTIADDSISYGTASGYKIINYPVGTVEHTYRVVGYGENWDLYIDNNLISDMDGLSADSSSAFLRFRSSGSSVMKVTGVLVNTYLPLNDPGKSMSFDDGDTCGFTLDSTGFWSSNGGYLKANDPSVTSSQPKVNMPVACSDDFYFESRMQFKSFGNWAGMRIYNRGQVLYLEMREKNFTLITPTEKSGQTGEQVALSDPISIDPEKWYNIKIRSYNACEYVRVYLDDVLIMETKLPTTQYTGSQMEFYTSGCATEACNYWIDWIRYLPVSKQSIGNMTTTERTASATLNTACDDGVVTASLSDMSGFSEVTSVTYLLDGKEVGRSTESPYQLTISGIHAGNHMVEAVCRDNDSFVVARATDALLIDSSMSTHYSNEISYTVSGAGVAEYKNGNHLLEMSHTIENVICLTDAGYETYPYGNGTFHIITDGPIAEVYWNGQFAFSYYMPMTSEIGSSFIGSISNVKTSIPEERKTYFAARNVTDQKQLYDLADFPVGHNLDFMVDSGDSLHLAVNDGYYRTDVTVEKGEIYVWDGKTNNAIPEKTKVDTIGSGEAYYRIETSGGMSRLYKNGRWVTSFRGGRSTGSATLSVDVTAGSVSYLSVNDNTDLYLYQDDFSESGELSATEFWKTTNLTMTVSNGVMTLDAAGRENAIAEINAFSGNFDLSAKVKVNLTGSLATGGFWFMLNRSTTESYTKAGYNHPTLYSKKYEVIDRVNGTNGTAQNTTGSLPTNQTVQLDLKVRQTDAGEQITLYVNGSQVLSQLGDLDRRGKVGFILSNCIATIEEFSYRGDAKPVPGIKTTVPSDSYSINLDLIEMDNNDLYLVNSGRGFKSSDGGISWETVYSEVGFGLADDGGGWNSHMLQLENGKVLSMVAVGIKGDYGKTKHVYRCYQSLDYGKTWTKIDTILQPTDQANYGLLATVNALKLGASGRIYFTHHDGVGGEDVGSAVVWYSDNEGQTWTRSVTIDGRVQGHILAEPQVVETENEDGGYNTRLYFRTEKGYLCYYTSPDRGITWDLDHLYKTPFLGSMACFNIEADPDDPNTVYVGWVYDNLNVYGRPQWPRTRWGLAKSTDGGDQWEFIGTLHENNIISYTNSNTSISVGKDYVIMGVDSMDEWLKNDKWNTNWRSRIAVVSKEVQKPSKRFEQLHLMYPGQIKNTSVIPDNRVGIALVVAPETGTALLHGERIENAVSGEYLSLAVAEQFLGWAIPVSDTVTIDGKHFMELSAFAKTYGLTMTEEDGILILSENGDWSVRQKKAFRYAIDLFGNQP